MAQGRQSRGARASACICHVRDAGAGRPRGLFSQQQGRAQQTQSNVFTGAFCCAVCQILQIIQAQSGFLKVFLPRPVDAFAQLVDLTSQPVNFVRCSFVPCEQKIFDSLGCHRQSHQSRANRITADAFNAAADPVGNVIAKRDRPLIFRPAILYLPHLIRSVSLVQQGVHNVLVYLFRRNPPGGLFCIDDGGQDFPIVTLFQPGVVLIV